MSTQESSTDQLLSSSPQAETLQLSAVPTNTMQALVKIALCFSERSVPFSFDELVRVTIPIEYEMRTMRSAAISFLTFE